MHLPRYLLSAGLLTSTTVASNSSKINGSTSAPVATVKNGTYYGLLNDNYNMDYFLGIPYAQPPIGDLRYQVPQSVNEIWNEPRNATEYGYACIGYGEDSQVAAHNYVNEDCLTLNVYRPAGYRNADDLPVLVWIHGGGFVQGAALDQRYNLTFMVEESAKVNKPIIAVSLNYRLGGWGFLFSGDMLEAGVTNLGIRDQRLALHWVQENIAAFGGDPTKVTIWGESAGGASVGIHLLAYNGRNDSLFRSAIAQSGAASGFGYSRGNATIAETAFANLVQSVGCAGATNKIACLRTLPMETLNNYYNNSTASYLPTPDGDIIARSFESQLQDGSFVKVPYLVGTNADEGTAFASFGSDTDNDTINNLLAYGAPSTSIPSLMELYPLNATDQVLKSHPSAFNSTIGLQWKRISTLLTDIMMVAPTRLTIQQMLRHTNTSIYHYNFNTIPDGVPDVWSITHFMEFAFVVHNTEGVGYLNLDPPYLGPNPFGGVPQSYYDLTDIMCGMWISFVNHGTPNYGVGNAPFWLPYTLEGKETIYFDANTTSYVGTDTYREAGIDFIIQDLLAKY